MPKERITKIRGIGTSLGIIIPHQLLKVLELNRGDEVYCVIDPSGALVIRRVERTIIY